MGFQSASKGSTDKKGIQTVDDGRGAKFHRVYWVDLSISFEQALVTMATLQRDLNAFSPTAIATFTKTKGREGELQVGDEIMVKISGPWDGPVIVTEVSPRSFALQTLDGHIEAGLISFRILKADDVNHTRFEIESITRSRDQIVNLFYDKLRLAMLAQTEMWELFCQNFSRAATNEPEATPIVLIKTERQDPDTGEWLDISNEIGAQGLSSEAPKAEH